MLITSREQHRRYEQDSTSSPVGMLDRLTCPTRATFTPGPWESLRPRPDLMQDPLITRPARPPLILRPELFVHRLADARPRRERPVRVVGIGKLSVGGEFDLSRGLMAPATGELPVRQMLAEHAQHQALSPAPGNTARPYAVGGLDISAGTMYISPIVSLTPFCNGAGSWGVG